jgi:glycosyltransferase involved in cell wall biosynthesis
MPSRTAKRCSVEDMNTRHSNASVAMCTFNGARFLAEQLRSVASQTLVPVELVICDDGSTDDSVSIIREFSRKAPFPVQVFQNKTKLGPAKNFEKAIQKCKGEIIFLCDQDDVWQPEKIERLIDAFDKHPQATYAFSNAEMIDESGDPLGQTLWDAVGLSRKLEAFSGTGQLEILLKHNIVTGATMAFRASFRDLVLPISADWMHDYWIVLLGSTVSNGIPVSEPLLKYRRHATQVCGWRKDTFWQVCMESLNARAEDWRGKVDNFRRLVDRVQSSPLECPPERMALLREKELHLLTRSSTRGSNALLRIAKVLAEATTGRYHRFSDSWYSIVRDL